MLCLLSYAYFFVFRVRDFLKVQYVVSVSTCPSPHLSPGSTHPSSAYLSSVCVCPHLSPCEFCRNQGSRPPASGQQQTSAPGRGAGLWNPSPAPLVTWVLWVSFELRASPGGSRGLCLVSPSAGLYSTSVPCAQLLSLRPARHVPGAMACLLILPFPICL